MRVVLVLRRCFRALATVALVCAPAGCLIDLERGIACGDGYIDFGQGEECDPKDPERRYLDACTGERRNGEGACDPETCQLIVDEQQCAICGDTIQDAFLGEECDGSDLGTPPAVCPSGIGQPRCTSDCTIDFGPPGCEQCGNGVVQPDEGEECEPVEPGDIVGSSTHCSELENLFGAGDPYISGEARVCDRETCLWDRTGCGFCGNAELDQTSFVAPGIQAQPEFCDGDTFDLDVLAQQVPNALCDADDSLRASVACGDDCRSFVERPDEYPCCVITGGPCPRFGAPEKCCIELENPGISASDICSPQFGDETVVLCN